MMSRCIGIPEVDIIIAANRNHKTMSKILKVVKNKVLIHGRIVSYTRKDEKGEKTKQNSDM